MYGERCKLPDAPPSRSGVETLTILVHLKKGCLCHLVLNKSLLNVKSKNWLLISYSGTVHELHRNRWVSLILFRFNCPSAASAATHSSRHPHKSVTGWVGPSLCAHDGYLYSPNVWVLRSYSTSSMLKSNDLRLPRRGIEPVPSGFWEVGSTARPLPPPPHPLVRIDSSKNQL